MSTITIEITEPIRESLPIQGYELSQMTLEGLAVEGYRREMLSRGQVGEMLGLSFWQTEAFLKERHAYLHYDIHDFEQDLATLDRLQKKHA